MKVADNQGVSRCYLLNGYDEPLSEIDLARWTAYWKKQREIDERAIEEARKGR